MTEKLLDKSSYGLLRTNPKLTGNVKIVSNETDIYLESFSANTQLSSSKFKAFKVSGESTYDKDVHKFFNNGRFPKDLAYDVFQAYSDVNILSKYKDQYEMFYSAGTRTITSTSYDESLGMFAPLYLNEQIPKYFVIFRVDGPVTVNGKNNSSQFTDISVAQTSIEFKEKILNNCTAVKTFDLSDNSKLGKYIRRYREQDGFPSAPLNVSWRKDEPFRWNGISYEFGGFTSNGKFVYEDFVTKDTTIMNFEYLVSKGFEQCGVLSANILNLEFLFDDPNVNDYEINRYFGLYVNDIEEGEFKLSGEGFFDSPLTTQTPQITSTKTISKDLNTPLEISNPNGVLLYVDGSSVSTVTGFPTSSRVNEVESIFYVKNKDDDFYTVRRGSNWGENELRLSNKKIDISKLSGLDSPEAFTYATLIDEPGHAMMSIKVLGALQDGVRISLYDGDDLISDIAANSSEAVTPGTNSGTFFNPTGGVSEIVKAITSAVNDGIPEEDRFFTASYSGDTVYLISRLTGTRFNKLKFTVNWDEYDPINIKTYPLTSTSILTQNFVGGTDKNKTQLKVNINDVDRFVSGKYIKSLKGYVQITGYVPYTLEPSSTGNSYTDIDKYMILQLEEPTPSISNTGQISLYSEFKPTFGRFSIFPIKDFDFDFYSDQYSNLGELLYEKNYYTDTALSEVGSNPDIIDFYSDGGFANLLGLLKASDPDETFDSTINSEYERLEENYLKSQAVSSRVIPYINKWGYYKGGKDVRNNPYRLNLSEAFTTNNFAPSKYDYKRSPYGFSHEWYYLSEIPSYFTDDAVEESWSYFTSAPTDSTEPAVNGGIYVPGTFQDITTNNFDEFFIADKLINGSSTVLIDRQLRYGTFEGGNDQNFAETFLRGVKVIAKKLSDPNVTVNFNANSLSYTLDSEFNDYKFSVMLVPNSPDKPRQQIKIVKNEKWKTIVMMIFITVEYDCINDSEQTIDRTSLYSLRDAYSTNSDCTPDILTDGSYTYESGLMQGALKFDSSGSWSEDPSKFLITGQPDINGSPTKFIRDLTIGLDGQYNNIQFEINNDTYSIEGITRVLSDDKFVCTTINKNGSPIFVPTFNPPNTTLRNATYVTVNGGYQKFVNLLNSVSFASIADSINKGDPSVVYETVKEDGNPVVDANGNFVQTFMLELRAPDDILKSIYVGAVPDPNKPTIFNLIDVIGYDLSLQTNPRLTPIFRHSGKYEPISYDVFKFRDPYLEYDFTNPTGSTSQIIDEDYKQKVFELTRHANTQFNSSDVSNFGQIRNLFYHKINPEDPASVLELFNDKAFQSLYPLINEVGIDYKYSYIFSSNWDPGYFDKYIDKGTKVRVIGTRSMTEKPAFFGSKNMETPDVITLETFSGVPYQENAISQPSLANGTFMYRETNSSIETYLFIEKRLEEFLFTYVKESITRYINPEFGFGNTDTLDDDVYQYIRQNLLKRYRIGSIDLYTKSSRTVGETNYTTAELDNTNKVLQGLSLEDNFSAKILNRNSFDTRLIYNKKVGYSESIGFSVSLIKK